MPPDNSTNVPKNDAAKKKITIPSANLKPAKLWTLAYEQQLGNVVLYTYAVGFQYCRLQICAVVRYFLPCRVLVGDVNAVIWWHRPRSDIYSYSETQQTPSLYVKQKIVRYIIITTQYFTHIQASFIEGFIFKYYYFLLIASSLYHALVLALPSYQPYPGHQYSSDSHQAPLTSDSSQSHPQTTPDTLPPLLR